MTKFFPGSATSFSRNTVRGALLLMALPLAACNSHEPYNRSVESVHQPVVSYSTFVYDVRNDGAGLSQPERDRFIGWLDSVNVAYGDRLAVATQGGYVSRSLQDDLAAVLNKRGMTIGEDTTAAAGVAPAGSVRLILRRATASVPGCPDWRHTHETDTVVSTSSNYGCATNSNLAAMVANPQDLLTGVESTSTLRNATASRAIESYKKQAPTGEGGLKSA